MSRHVNYSHDSNNYITESTKGSAKSLPQVKIINKYITHNPYYNDGRYLTGSNFKGFFLHSVGCSQPDPMVFINNWNRPGYTNAGVNGFIGSDAAYITAPCLETKGKVKRMPHAGSPANNYYIGFEMCEPDCIHYTRGAKFTISDRAAARSYVTKTYNNAVALFAKLCEFHGKNPLQDGVILSHAEGAARGIATNHGDPEHLWKGLGMNYTMDTFRRDVASYTGGTYVTGDDYTVAVSSEAAYFLSNIELTPYVITLSRNSPEVDYKKLKEIGVVGACIEAGYLYDESHKVQKLFTSPKLREQAETAVKNNIPFGLYAIVRAKNEDEAKEEMYWLSFCIRKFPPSLGMWLKLKLPGKVEQNTKIIEIYKNELIRLGLQNKIGFYVTKNELKSIKWEDASQDWWLWINSHLDNLDNIEERISPGMFATDEVP